MKYMPTKENIIGLYRRCATELPSEITNGLKESLENEKNENAREILKTILENINTAKKESKPICQDTGTPIFYVKYPKNYSQRELKKIIDEATIIATKEIPLRPNAVDSLTDKNVGNKPVIHFEESDKLKIDLFLKGGGSENISAIYHLPDKEINAHRNLDGVRKCVLNAVFKAQGKGCPPYIIGVAIGGSIEEVANLSKKQLLRKIDDINPILELRDFEKNALNEINKLNIGPLGLGGKTTALGIKITTSYRHPASFFVGISFGCWALRRQSYEE